MLNNDNSCSLSRGCLCYCTQKVWTKEQEGLLSWFINWMKYLELQQVLNQILFALKEEDFPKRELTAD